MARDAIVCHELALVCLIRGYLDCASMPHALQFAILDFCLLVLEDDASNLGFNEFMDRLRTCLKDCSHSDIKGLYEAFQLELTHCNDEANLYWTMTSEFDHPDDPTPRSLTFSSYLGIFTRKVALEVKQLTFHQMIALIYRFRGWLDSKFLPAEEPKKTFTDADIDAFHATRVSSLHGKHAQAMNAAFQVHAKKAESDREESYTRFVRAWRRGDYSTALENLSRYFDYALGDTGRSSYQYALLNLALLQADFGCLKEALWAIHETIDAARDAKDDVCLIFALSWLSSLSDTGALDAEPTLKALQVDQHVIRRAQENKLPKIEAAAYLARCGTSSGGEALASLLKSQRATIDADCMLGREQYLAAAGLWRDVSCLPLADLSLSLACTLHPPDDSAEHANLLCAMARRLRQQGRLEEAKNWMEAEEGALTNHAYHSILEMQAALFRNESCDETGSPLKADDALMETLAMQKDALAYAPRVRRALTQGDLGQARTILGELQKSKQSPQIKALHLQLTGELWLASAEPERALVPTAQLLKHCLEACLYHDYKLAWELFERVATALGPV